MAMDVCTRLGRGSSATNKALADENVEAEQYDLRIVHDTEKSHYLSLDGARVHYECVSAVFGFAELGGLLLSLQTGVMSSYKFARFRSRWRKP